MSSSLFLVAGLLLGGITIGNEQIGNYEDNSKFESLNYVVEHMDEFNEVRMDEGYAPTDVDFIKSVPINTFDGRKLEGRLLKLNEGYILFGEDDVIHKISYTDDVSINKLSILEFYDIGGFVEYDKKTGEYESLYQNKQGDSINSSTPVIYDGQMNSGEGSIYEPIDYIASRYGEGFYLYESYQIRSQVDRNIKALNASIVEMGQYKTNLGVNYFIDEDMYSLVIATILADFVEKTYEIRFSRMAGWPYDCEANEPDIYNYKTTHGWWLTNNYLTKLNIMLRKYMYQQYGTYAVLTKEQIRDIVVWFANQYGYPLSFEYTNVWRSIYTMTDFFSLNLKKDRIMIVDISNSETYGDLVGCAVGYRLYEKKSYVLGIEVYNQVYLLEFRDTFLYANNYLDITWPGIGAKTITFVTSPESFNA
ncbi:MAG: hypothetical protein J1F32_00030 [Erysipelotrichales bacterium]|nr:hypothetical protein [Erysipelotrichales bacterium]